MSIAMFVDDFTGWPRGRDNAPLELITNGLIIHWQLWVHPHNMVLTSKHGKSILFTNNCRDWMPLVIMYRKVLQSMKQTDWFGVILDAQLTMKGNFSKLMHEGSQQIQQLACSTNWCFGPLQILHWNTKIAFIWSVLEYAPLVWYLCMSKQTLHACSEFKTKYCGWSLECCVYQCAWLISGSKCLLILLQSH